MLSAKKNLEPSRMSLAAAPDKLKLILSFALAIAAKTIGRNAERSESALALLIPSFKDRRAAAMRRP